MLEVLLQTPAARRVGQHILAANETLHVPHLIDLEIAQVLRRYVRSGALANDRAEEALADLADLPLTRYPHFVLLPRIWQMRHNATAYDAAYLALAEALDAPLITRDRALARGSSHARVEVV
jgi:predicted nucleic acid-binding protein